MDESVEDGQNSTAVDHLLAEGNLLIDRGSYEEAINVFAKAAALDGSRADPYNGWGRALASQNKYEQARWKFDRAISIDENYTEAYVNVGNTLCDTRRYDEAIQRFQKAIELDQESAAAWHGEGRALLGLDMYEEALEKLTKAIHLNSDFVEARLTMGDALFDLGGYRKALDQFQHVIQIERVKSVGLWPAFTARYSSGRALIGLEQYAEASTWFKEALKSIERFEAVPQFKELIAATNGLIGALQVELKQYAEAVASLRKASGKNLKSTIYAHSTIAGVFWRQGKYSSAWAELGTVLRTYELASETQSATTTPSEMLDGDALASVASGLFDLGELKKAEEQYNLALERNGRHLGAWAGLVNLYLRKSEDDVENANDWYCQAREAFRKAEALIREDLSQLDQDRERASMSSTIQALVQEELEDYWKKRRASRLLDLATLLMRMDQYNDAEPHLREAIQLNSELVTAHANLGTIQQREENFKQAALCFEDALRRDPDNPQLRISLGEAYFGLGLLEKARYQYRVVLRAAPCNIEAHFGLGEVLTAIGDEDDPDFYVQAMSHFSKAMSLAKSMMAPEPQDRKGSTRLTAKQLAAAYYASGYAKIQLHEARLQEGLFAWDRQRLLPKALDDFRSAFSTDPDHFKAERAVDKIEQRHRTLSPERVGERWAPALVAMLSLIVLSLVQTSFFLNIPAVDLDVGYYVLLTFGALAFVTAGLYLPQVLKLKVAGVELEKSAVEKTVVVPTLAIAKDPLSVKLSSEFGSAFGEAIGVRVILSAPARGAGGVQDASWQPTEGAENLGTSNGSA